jgi:DUF971 family protein
MSQPASSVLSAAPVAAPTQVAVSDACKCAHCIRARIDGVFPERFDGIVIVQVLPIGDYAVNLAFSDGHARGIYPWSFLFGLNDA